MPTPEMLKKLLDEFAEKEAHATEEVNLITQQIEELERRVMVSQQRLDTLARDREKVRTMQARYKAGEYASTNQFESSNSGMPTAASMSLGSQTAGRLTAGVSADSSPSPSASPSASASSRTTASAGTSHIGHFSNKYSCRCPAAVYAFNSRCAGRFGSQFSAPRTEQNHSSDAQSLNVALESDAWC